MSPKRLALLCAGFVLAMGLVATAQPVQAQNDAHAIFRPSQTDNAKTISVGSIFGGTSSSQGSNTTTEQLKKMIENLQKRVANLTAQVKKQNQTSNQSSGDSRAVSAGVNFNVNMGVGSRGQRVLDLQACLEDLGHFSGEKADIYGPQTREAVKKFQAAEGIVSTGNEWSTGYGYVGPSTRKALNAKCAGVGDSGSTDAPSTNFTATPTSGNAPLEVTFTSKAFGDEVYARVKTNKSDTSVRTIKHGTDVAVGDEKFASNEWFPLTEDGEFIKDDDYGAKAEFKGLSVYRMGDGTFQVRHFGENKTGYEYSEGVIEIKNGMIASFEKVQFEDHSGVPYDKANKVNATKISFSTRVSTGNDTIEIDVDTDVPAVGSEIDFGDGDSEEIDSKNIKHTYKNGGTYSAVITNPDGDVLYRKTIKVNDKTGANNTGDPLPDDPEGDSLVELEFRIGGDDAGYYGELPRKVQANRKTKIRWNTENVNNCRLTLAYDNDRIYKTIRSTAGTMEIDKIKPWDALGLDYVEIRCKDEDGEYVRDRVTVEFYDTKEDFRLFVDQEEEREFENVTREEAMSRCLEYALSSKYKKEPVGCVFGESIIYQHGDDPFPESLIAIIDPDEDTEVYEDGDESDEDDGEGAEEEEDQYKSEVVNITAVKSGYKAIVRIRVDGLVCGPENGSRVVGTMNWGDGQSEDIDWFCDGPNLQQTNSHKYAKAGIYKVEFTTKVGKHSDSETVAIGRN